MRFIDKVVIVTGAGAGIGRSAVVMFSQEGAKATVNSLSQESGSETACSGA